MADLVIKTHAGGIDRSEARFAIADGRFVTIRNRRPRGGGLEGRPGQAKHLNRISENQPGTGLARFHQGGDSPIALGPRSPLTVVSVADGDGGTIPWATPENAKASDDAYAISGPGFAPQQTQLLKATNFEFPPIPATATITGIKVRIEKRASFLNVVDQRVWILKAGVVPTDPAQSRHQTTANWPLVDAVFTYGGEGDLWEQTWVPADFLDPTFGTAFKAYLGGTFPNVPAGAYVDDVSITVYYTTLEATKQTLFYVGPTLYTDKSGAWANISGANVLQPDANLEAVMWKGNAYIQDGENGPYKYDGTTFSPWTGGANPPPIARYMMLDVERLYAAGVKTKRAAVKASTRDDADDWPDVARPAGDEGVLMYVGREDGEFITGIGRLGTTKFLFKRHFTYRLLGDSADTWDLGPKPYLHVGCIAHRTIQECGNELCWTDGRRVYSLGPNGFDPNFGREIEPLLRLTPMSEWAKRCAIFWDSLYILWYTATDAVAFDFASRAWFGPWNPIPSRVAIVERDTDVPWIGSSTVGEVNKLEGTSDRLPTSAEGSTGLPITDNGLQIPWQVETKHYSLGHMQSRARNLFVTADAEIGSLTVEIIASGARGQTDDRIITRVLQFTGTGVRTLVIPLAPTANGVYLGTRITGAHALGKLYEYGLRADRLRARAG